MEGLSAEDMARQAMEISSDMCVFTNKNFLVETMDCKEEEKEEEKAESKKE